MEYALNYASVDTISEEFVDFFEKCAVPKREIQQMRLSLEEALLAYCRQLGEGKSVTTHTAKWFGHCRFEVRIAGESLQPFTETAEDEYLGRLLAKTGQRPAWNYKNGANHLVFSRSVGTKLSPTAWILLAIILGALAGIASNQLLGEQTASMISQSVLVPISDTIMSLTTAFTTLLIFTTVINSIGAAGDISTFSTIGKRMLSRFAVWDLIYSGVSLLLMLLIFPPTSSSDSSGGIASLYEMLLDIVPSDVVSPFIDGNTIQIIFLAATVGIALLVLGGKATAMKDFFSDSEKIAEMLVGAVIGMMPIVIFINLFTLGTLGNLGVVFGMVHLLGLYLLFALLQIGVSLLRVCVTNRIRPFTVLKKISGTMLIAFATCSSAAALPSGSDDCVKRLGISPKLAGIGLPLGQVLYRPTVALEDICMCFCFAAACGVPISLQWALRLLVISIMMSIALPPVPGAGPACFGILLAQAGIPMEMLAVALAVDFILDRIATSSKFAILEMDLLQIAGSLDMVDKKILHGTD